MYKIVANIKNIPEMDKLIQFDNFVDDPEFTKIKEKARSSTIDIIRQPHVKDIEPVINGSHSFDRYFIDQRHVERLGELLGLRKPTGRIQVQEPGIMGVMHLDDLYIGYINPFEDHRVDPGLTEEEKKAFSLDPRTAGRYLIMLEDSVPGQGMVFHDQGLTSWKAGDVISWDWPTVAHATFNASFWSRPLVRVTGLATDLFHEITNTETKLELDYKD